MRRTLVIISLCAIIAIVMAIIGQALVVTQNVVFTPSGAIANPTSLAQTASLLSGIGTVLSFPLTLATLVLGLALAGQRAQPRWLSVMLVAGGLALLGLFAMAWTLLSANVPVAFVTPLVLVPLLMLTYLLRPYPARSRALRTATSS